MMNNRVRHQANLNQLGRVVKALGHMKDKVVFIGGSVIGLLISDEAAPDVRTTNDVDLIVEAIGLRHSDIEAEFRNLGFTHDISVDAHIARFLLDDLKVDILPIDGTDFGMNTDWHQLAVSTAQTLAIDGQTIRVISAPLLICTKLAAFHDRGRDDLKTSKDFEDILSIVDGREELLAEIIATDNSAKRYLTKQFAALLDNVNLPEAILWQLESDQQEREDIILSRMKAIASIKD